MSFIFNASNERMLATLATPIAMPFMMGFFFKPVNYILATRGIATLSANVAVADSFGWRMANNADNRWTWYNRDATVQREVSIDRAIDNTWTGFLGLARSTTSRICWVGDNTPSTEGTGLASMGTSFTLLRLGEEGGGGNDLGQDLLDQKIAEFCLWDCSGLTDSRLSDQEIADFMGGLSAAFIQPSKLRVYSPFSSAGGTQANLGLDTGGDFTVTGATFDTDHPIISGGGSAGAGSHYYRQAS